LIARHYPRTTVTKPVAAQDQYFGIAISAPLD
jgi:hypothetical protein